MIERIPFASQQVRGTSVVGGFLNLTIDLDLSFFCVRRRECLAQNTKHTLQGMAIVTRGSAYIWRPDIMNDKEEISTV